jgi:signal transduction histidine kinase
LWNAQSYSSQLDPAERVLYAAAVDITDRKQTEIALQQSEQRLRISQLAAKIGTWEWDIAANTAIWSPEYYTLYGIDPNTPATYDRWLADVLPVDRESADRAMRTALAQQQTHLEFEFRIVHPTQGIRWFGSRSQIFYAPDGQPLRAIGISIDITDRKQAEVTLAERARELTDLNSRLAQTASQLKERNQELDSFVHVVSHDLKAPLRAIANLSEWIEEDLAGISAHTTEQMNLLRGRVHRMETTIDGLLQYARVGRQDSQLELVSVADLLAEIVESIAPPPTFKIDISTPLPTIETRKLLLSQVFTNLISNAFKHHDRLDGSVRISSTDRGDFYEFAIADDGCGIAPEDRDRVFVIFQAANPQKNPDSTGVGLSIVKKIIEAESGTIRLESELGKGTTFYFTWPKRSSIVERGQ